jgi:hypothetical protein
MTSRSESVLRAAVGALLLAGSWACFPSFDVEGQPCGPSGECLSGYVCEAGACVSGSSGSAGSGSTGGGCSACGRGTVCGAISHQCIPDDCAHVACAVLEDCIAPVDAGRPDAGAADAGHVDAGAVDAGAVDAGSVDGGAVDAGSVDAGHADAGSVDAGPAGASCVARPAGELTACQTDADCPPPRATCVTTLATGTRPGFCAAPCNSLVPCATSQRCATLPLLGDGGVSLCMPLASPPTGCTGDASCGEFGLRCVTYHHVATATSPTGVAGLGLCDDAVSGAAGQPCLQAGDCASGLCAAADAGGRACR